MRKHVFGRRLKRDKNERKALFKSLMSSLVIHEKIKTTEEKAKAIKGSIEKLITLANKDGKMALKKMSGYLNPEALRKMVKEVAPRFKERRGGYTRIIKIGNRLSDNANLVIMEWTETKVESSRLPFGPELRVEGKVENGEPGIEKINAEIKISKKEKKTARPKKEKTARKKIKK